MGDCHADAKRPLEKISEDFVQLENGAGARGRAEGVGPPHYTPVGEEGEGHGVENIRSEVGIIHFHCVGLAGDRVRGLGPLLGVAHPCIIQVLFLIKDNAEVGEGGLIGDGFAVEEERRGGGGGRVCWDGRPPPQILRG